MYDTLFHEEPQPEPAGPSTKGIVFGIMLENLMITTIVPKRIVTEKLRGSRELLKMMGVANHTYWTSQSRFRSLKAMLSLCDIFPALHNVSWYKSLSVILLLANRLQLGSHDTNQGNITVLKFYSFTDWGNNHHFLKDNENFSYNIMMQPNNHDY